MADAEESSLVQNIHSSMIYLFIYLLEGEYCLLKDPNPQI